MQQTAPDIRERTQSSSDWDEVPCPTCGPGAPNRLLFRRTDGHGIRFCDECGLIFTSPRFSARKLAEIYEGVNEIQRVIAAAEYLR